MAPGLRQRLVSVALVLPAFLVCLLLLPNAAWAVLTCVPIVVAAIEWSALGGYRRARFLFSGLILVTGIVLYALTRWHAQTAMAAMTSVLLASMLFWTVLAPLWLRYGWGRPHPILHGAAGWMVLVPAWIALVQLQRTPWILLMILVVVWLADTAAYFCGKSFGRRKMVPNISPGKTWEGAAGGFLAVAAYALILGSVSGVAANFGGTFGLLIMFMVLTGLSIVGDLFESWIKRLAAVKDSGTLMPGHGGILDRADSLTATLPFAALCLNAVAAA